MIAEETVLEVRRRAALGEGYGSIALDLHIERSAVSRIARGEMYKAVGGDRSGLRRENHGLSKAPEYTVWCSMLKRCSNPRERDFPLYGGRGISVCPRWRARFMNFLADMGPRPSPGHSIERENNDGDYEPGNCHWASDAEQRRNKRTTRVIEFRGERLCVTDMALRHDLSPFLVFGRLRPGWSVERALTTRPCR